MKQSISVTREQREFLERLFGVSKVMISYALNYNAQWGQSELAKKIRRVALERGGVPMFCAPSSEVIHDASGYMCQYYANGWMWDANKRTGVLEVKNEENEVVVHIAHANLADIEAVQQRLLKLNAPAEATKP